MLLEYIVLFFCFKQKTAYEMRISDWSSDVCSSDLEVVRRALLDKEHAIVERLVADIDRDRTPPERRSDEARIRLALTSTWQTAEAPSQKHTVHDEVENVGFYLANVLYRELPVFYEACADAIEARSEEHTSDTQSLISLSYAVF